MIFNFWSGLAPGQYLNMHLLILYLINCRTRKKKQQPANQPTNKPGQGNLNISHSTAIIQKIKVKYANLIPMPDGGIYSAWPTEILTFFKKLILFIFILWQFYTCIQCILIISTQGCAFVLLLSDTTPNTSVYQLHVLSLSFSATH